MENELLQNLDKMHTTSLGALRIKKNLMLEVQDVVEWCKDYTIITAHKKKKI